MDGPVAGDAGAGSAAYLGGVDGRAVEDAQPDAGGRLTDLD